MKKAIIAFCLFLLPLTFVHPQTEVKSDCEINLEDIFKVHKLKIRYETVMFLDREMKKKDEGRGSFIATFSKSRWNEYSRLIKGVPMFEEAEAPAIPSDSIIKMTRERNDAFVKALRSIPENVDTVAFTDSLRRKYQGHMVPVKSLSTEELNGIIQELDCTPEKALEEYKSFIRDIKSQKEFYSACVDTEIAKGDSSEYAKKRSYLYSFQNPMSSYIGSIQRITQLEFLKVFREFIFNDDEEVLPDILRAYMYREHGSKIHEGVIVDIYMMYRSKEL